MGSRHLFALAATIAVGTVVGGLGTLSFPLHETPSGFAPATAIQVVAGVWFGAWGVVAGVIFPAIVRSLTGPDNLPGRVLADLVLSGLPAFWFRYFRRDPRLRLRRDRLVYLVVVVGLSNLVAALVGTTSLALTDAENWRPARWLAHVVAWFAAGAGPCLVLGLPLLRTLSPVITRSSLFCRGWWQSSQSLGPSMRRFRHQPIIVKILLGLSAAGFLPLLLVVVVHLWDDYRQARVRVRTLQSELADQIDRDLRQLLATHESAVARQAATLATVPSPESLSTGHSPFTSIMAGLAPTMQTAQLAEIQESHRIDNVVMQAMTAGKTAVQTGPGPPPERRRAINLMRLVASGAQAGTVVVDSIVLDELEQTVFASAARQRYEYALFGADGQSLLQTERFGDAQPAVDDGDATEVVAGAALLRHWRTLSPTGWKLGLMISQVYGVKEALAERRNPTAVVTTLALFAALMIGGYLARTLEQPISELTRTVRQAGRLDVEIEAVIHGHDEIGELAATFNEMSRQLRRSIAALERTTAEKERLSYEMELAASLQRRILPAAAPQIEGFDLAGLCIPAREVGGDFYDWHALSDIRWGLLIGDACGKGLPAAFLVNEARSLALSHLQDSPSPGVVLRRTNHTLFQVQSLEAAFTTMFCAVLTVPSGRLQFASAGHPAAILYRAATGELAALDTSGRPLGLDPENPIEQDEVTLAAGDVVVAFTDGALDAMDPSGEPFGRARLEHLVREHHTHPAAEIAVRIQQGVQDFCATTQQFDDFTLLVLRAVPLEVGCEAVASD
jgi:serine phosphatase RsbU (regulator of sigma subunit)